jgi:hypothetical protein
MLTGHVPLAVAIKALEHFYGKLADGLEPPEIVPGLVASDVIDGWTSAKRYSAWRKSFMSGETESST